MQISPCRRLRAVSSDSGRLTSLARYIRFGVEHHALFGDEQQILALRIGYLRIYDLVAFVFEHERGVNRLFIQAVFGGFAL